MRTTAIKGLVVRTDQGKIYLLEQLKHTDPKIRINNILTTLRERGPFLECRDAYNGLHYVNSDHISEIYVDDYTITEAD